MKYPGILFSDQPCLCIPQVLVDAERGNLAVLNRADGQIITADDTISTGPDAVHRGFLVDINNESLEATRYCY